MTAAPLLAVLLGAAFLDPPAADGDIDKRVRELAWYFADEGWPDVSSRRKAARELERMGSPARAALLRALHDRIDGTGAARALLAVDPDNKEAVPALLPDLKGLDPGVRCHACNVLGVFGEKGRPAIPALVGALRDPDSDVRRLAAHALAEVGRRDRRAVMGLVCALGDPVREVWHTAALALAKVDPAGARTIAALGALLLDREPDESIRRLMYSAKTLLDLALAEGAVVAVKVYLNDLEAMQESVRKRRLLAVANLAELTPAVKPALPALRLAADDGDPHVRRAAAAVLKELEGQEKRP
jgi:HEAT repeat protein